MRSMTGLLMPSCATRELHGLRAAPAPGTARTPAGETKVTRAPPPPAPRPRSRTAWGGLRRRRGGLSGGQGAEPSPYPARSGGAGAAAASTAEPGPRPPPSRRASRHHHAPPWHGSDWPRAAAVMDGAAVNQSPRRGCHGNEGRPLAGEAGTAAGAALRERELRAAPRGTASERHQAVW